MSAYFYKPSFQVGGHAVISSFTLVESSLMHSMQISLIQEGEWTNQVQEPYLQHQLAFLRRSFRMISVVFEPFLMEIDYSAVNGFPLVRLSFEESQFFERSRRESLRDIFERTNSPDSLVSLVQQGGEWYYTKRNLSRESIDKFLMMDERGIGVRVLSYSYPQNLIVMEAGIVLTDFVERRLNVSALACSLMAQINYIQLTLRSMGVAHCDIKPDNMIVTDSPEGVRLHLIDMDDAVLFGQVRQIGTYCVNMMGDSDNLGQATCESSDDLGFYFVKNFILLQS